MRLRTQKLSLPDAVRVEIAFEFPPKDDGPPVLAVLAYDDPTEALREACSFVETALAAVREEAGRAARTQSKLEADWARNMGARP